jgi:predicted NBD/HSP70 family sugar kinase
VGLEVEENGLDAILVDFTGKILRKIHSPLPDTQPQNVLESIASTVDSLCSMEQISRDRLAGIGIALPGIIDIEEGRVILSLPLGWQNVGIGRELSARLGLNVRVLNNALAGALTAYYEQNAPLARSLLFVLVQFLQPTHNGATPLGCGIVLDGRAYMGDGNRAGEIHVDIEHPLTRVGSMPGKNAPATMEELLALSRNDPSRYASIWDAFAEELGAVVSRGIDFLNPGKVVISTDIQEAEALIGNGLRKEIQSSHFRDKYAALGLVEDFLAVPVEFMTTQTETLAKGAIVPHLQEPALAPSLRQGVLM